MRIRQIQFFHAVFVNGSISAAAKELDISQPTVSKGLLRFEDVVGFSLFIRNGNGLIATQKAKNLVPYVQDVLSSLNKLDNAEKEIRESRI